jgi:hypothetical protein
VIELSGSLRALDEFVAGEVEELLVSGNSFYKSLISYTHWKIVMVMEGVPV